MEAPLPSIGFQEWLASAFDSDLGGQAQPAARGANEPCAAVTAAPGQGWQVPAGVHGVAPAGQEPAAWSFGANGTTFEQAASPEGPPSPRPRRARSKPTTGAAARRPREQETAQQRAHRLFYERKKEQLSTLLADVAARRTEVAALTDVNTALRRRAGALELAVAAADAHIAALAAGGPAAAAVAAAPAPPSPAPAPVPSSPGGAPREALLQAWQEVPELQPQLPLVQRRPPLPPRPLQVMRSQSEDLAAMMAPPRSPVSPPLRSLSADLPNPGWAPRPSPPAVDMPPPRAVARIGSFGGASVCSDAGVDACGAAAPRFVGYCVTTEGSALVRASSSAGSSFSASSAFALSAGNAVAEELSHLMPPPPSPVAGYAPQPPASPAAAAAPYPSQPPSPAAATMPCWAVTTAAGPFSAAAAAAPPPALFDRGSPAPAECAAVAAAAPAVGTIAAAVAIASPREGLLPWYRSAVAGLESLLRQTDAAGAPAAKAAAARDVAAAVAAVGARLAALSAPSASGDAASGPGGPVAAAALLATNLETEARAAPSDAHWRSILAQIGLSPAQRAAALDAYALYKEGRAAAEGEKAALLQDLQGSGACFHTLRPRLQRLLSSEAAAAAVLARSLLRVLAPLQVARCCVYAWPFLPSPVDLLAALEEEAAQAAPARAAAAAAAALRAITPMEV